MNFFLNILLSSVVISATSWLAGSRPALAGFIIALPISSMLAIALTQSQWSDPEKTITFAKSIFISIPLSLTFFVPFLFSKQLKLPFWGLYGAGVLLLVVSYAIFRKAP